MQTELERLIHQQTIQEATMPCLPPWARTGPQSIGSYTLLAEYLIDNTNAPWQAGKAGGKSPFGLAVGFLPYQAWAWAACRA